MKYIFVLSNFFHVFSVDNIVSYQSSIGVHQQSQNTLNPKIGMERKISEVRMELKPPTSSEENVDDDIPDDPWCDDLNPRICNFENISAAAYKIRDGIVRTPCDV